MLSLTFYLTMALLEYVYNKKYVFSHLTMFENHDSSGMLPSLTLPPVFGIISNDRRVCDSNIGGSLSLLAVAMNNSGNLNNYMT